MIDYEAVLAVIKKKIDRRMAQNNPESSKYEACFVGEDGKYESGQLDLMDDGWTRSFLTGAVAYMYYHFKDEKYYDYLKKSMPVYDRNIYEHLNGVSHDTGFLYTLYAGAMYEVSGNNDALRLGLKAADEFSKRFNRDAGVINGFGGIRREDAVIPIVDDMMNISILMWAWRQTKHPYFEELFTTHIRTVLQYMLRENFTFRHAFLFEGKTGIPLGERNYCGYSCGSVWARGQMWGIYGLVNALKSTGNEIYIQFIDGIVNRIMAYMGDSFVPYWDFDCISEKTNVLDTSAAAILACALLKLAEILPQGGAELSGRARECAKFADSIIETLVNEYLAPEDFECILTNGQVGSRSIGCVWGDYFFVEAVMKKIHGKENPDFFV